MFRPDRATLRSAGTVLLLTGVFVLVNSQVVYAAGSNSETGDLLAPLNIYSSEGVPLDAYELNAEGGSIFSFETQSLAFALSGLFALIRLLVGLAGWGIEMAFRFPLLKILLAPAQKVSDAYNHVVVDALGLKGLLLAWAFVFTGFMIVRGRVGRGLGEMFLTLLIAAFAASAFVRPDYLLTQDGPLGQTQEVAAAVAQESINSYEWGGKLSSRGPCDGMAGNQEIKCLEHEAEQPISSTDVARPLQDSVTNALIVKPYMLLQYGRILDPGKPGDRKAYAVHLKWLIGGYKAGPPSEQAEEACSNVAGPGKEYCIKNQKGGQEALPDGGGGLPALTPGGELLDAARPVITEEDQEFAAYLADMKKAGDVGKACAEYAEKPTWWRVGGAFLLLIAALFICGMLLSSTIVLLGTQGICAAAAAVGGVTFIAGMLPGPARQSVWKWLSLWGISMVGMVAICAFVPAFGIAIDATLTNGPQLMVERILLIDVLAIAGAAGHRRLLTGITSFGRRMAMRMRYATVGGTHMPGDTSELGAALAMNSPAALGGYGGQLRALTGGGGGRYGILGTRQRLMGALSSLVDGAGMPVDTGGILADATAEAGRGLAPLTAGVAVAGLGARLGGKGAHWLLIGRRPDKERLAKWRKATADGDPNADGPWAGGGGPGGGGPRRPGGPPDRYRDEDGQVVDTRTGQVLHDQHADRTLLSTRAHNRLVRYRGYRLLHRGGRAAYGTTMGLPANAGRARAAGSRYAQDARQQVRVWGNTLREDGRAWGATSRQISAAVRDRTGGSGGTGPVGGRRLPTRPTPAPEPTGASGSGGTGSTGAPPDSGSTAPSAPSRLAGGASREPTGPAAHRPSSRLPGRGASGSTRDEARVRMQELMRRTAPEAERRRQERQRDERGDAESFEDQVRRRAGESDEDSDWLTTNEPGDGEGQ
ncbi:hypothetical protein [Streptomyces sp. PAN_FS17]|uniref:hypothetical protein n=1 Tax=Streptomyces sp. PAN_FS17 TaxID=1855351 RepID=UPI00089585F6|nr:hypothetical protein [Streptomyces sp. PAN_FS17]SEE11153.1 hypothetical protein SAMN05216482_9249 [Streptomyces sp. PAN_FS17]